MHLLAEPLNKHGIRTLRFALRIQTTLSLLHLSLLPFHFLCACSHSCVAPPSCDTGFYSLSSFSSLVHLEYLVIAFVGQDGKRHVLSLLNMTSTRTYDMCVYSIIILTVRAICFLVKGDERLYDITTPFNWVNYICKPLNYV